MKRLTASPLTVQVGLVLFTLVVLAAVIGPRLINVDPNAIDLRHQFAGPSPSHPLGTDSLGRDVLARLLNGARASLFICLAAVFVATILGHALGLAAGYAGGLVDLTLGRVIDLLFAIPSLLIAIAIAAALGPSISTVVIAIGVSYCPSYARIVRASVVGVRDRGYVEASRVTGAGWWRILRLDVLPGILPVSVVQSTTLVASALIDEAGLGFLGVGVQPPAASWGSMLADSRSVLLYSPFLALVPAIALVIAVLAVNLVGDGLAGARDPRLSIRGLRG
jgi:ABC-type dipeptide/oligopeptide/nickel transport system permease subunit